MDKTRNSGVDLLKIIAIYLIVLGHVCQTISNKSPYLVEYANSNFAVFPRTLSF